MIAANAAQKKFLQSEQQAIAKAENEYRAKRDKMLAMQAKGTTNLGKTTELKLAAELRDKIAKIRKTYEAGHENPFAER